MTKNAADVVEARWVGPFEAELVDKTILTPGETVVSIPRAEAIASENWEVLGGNGGPTKDDLKKEAEKLGVTVPSRAKKSDIEELIAKAIAAGPEDEAPDGDEVGAADGEQPPEGPEAPDQPPTDSGSES
jgi:hypothetical protein